MGDVMELWNDFEACTVEGRYPLGKLVRTEGRRAWFETQQGDGKTALIILTESLNDEDVLLERLQSVEKIHHPNLVAVRAAGATSLKDTPLVYAITEHTEENLDDVLRERPLSAEEARELLEGLLSALSVIHSRGLVHGRMEAANVLAAGDTIKLRSDCIHAVPPDASMESAAGEDLRGLGTILFQALTQRQPQNALDPAIQRLPSPFAQIVQRSLSGLATTVEIESLLRPVGRPGVPAAKPAKPAKTTAPAVASSAIPISTQPASSLSVEDPADVDDAEAAPRWKSAPVIVALFVVLLAIAAYFVYSVFKSPSNPAPDKSATVVTNPPARAGTNGATPAISKPGPAIIVRDSAAKPVKGHSAASATGASIWRVVVYTYNRRDQAEHKVEEISAKHSDLQPEVFSPRGNTAPFFVTVGGAMDREQAYQEREKARTLGMPRDTFARNFR